MPFTALLWFVGALAVMYLAAVTLLAAVLAFGSLPGLVGRADTAPEQFVDRAGNAGAVLDGVPRPVSPPLPSGGPTTSWLFATAAQRGAGFRETTSWRQGDSRRPLVSTRSADRSRMTSTTPRGGTDASAGESATHLGHICGKTLGQRSTIELGDRRSLTDSFSEELADEMRHGEATFGGHGIETGRQVAGEAYREVSVLAGVHLRPVVDGLARLFLEPLDRLRLRHDSSPLSRSIACVMAIAMSTANDRLGSTWPVPAISARRFMKIRFEVPGGHHTLLGQPAEPLSHRVTL